MNIFFLLVISMAALASSARLGSQAIKIQTGSPDIDESVQELRNYCPENVELYLCRVQVQSDCENGDRGKACKTLNRIVEYEMSHIQKVTKVKLVSSTPSLVTPVDQSKLGCPSPLQPKVIDRAPAALPVVMNDIVVQRGSPNITNVSDEKLIEMENKPQWIPLFREKNRAIEDLRNQINKSQVQVQCNNDSDCRVQPFGVHGCGGYEGSFSYSVINGTPGIIGDVVRFTQLDGELRIAGYASTCSIYLVPKPQCWNNLCQ